MLGEIALYDWKSEEAGIRFERALELNPSHASAYARRATLLSLAGRHEAALAAALQARALDPFSPTNHVAPALALLAAGDCARAIEELDRTLALEPS